MVGLIRDKRGASIIAAILAILIFALLIAVVVSVVTIGSSVGLQEELGIKAFYIADGGLQFALYNGSLCDFEVGATALGGGSFAVTNSCMGTWSGCSTPATLSADIDAVITTIGVNDPPGATGYFVPGTIMIGSEYAFCNAASTTQFSECARGVRGTTAAVHSTGDDVIQCTVTSTGTYSSGLYFGDVKRTVRVNVGE